MSEQINAVNYREQSNPSLLLEDLPNICPYCHHTIVPKVRFSFKEDVTLRICFSCTNYNCQELFIGYYQHKNNSTYSLKKTSKGNYKSIEFSETIKETSPDFIDIYKQSYQAEQDRLDQIAGPGYRKALEFLIKDYLIQVKGESKESIASTALSTCINNYIDNQRLKNVAERAVWIGNDETHYERRWENKDINSLKKYIDIVLGWIEESILYDEIMADMPGKDPK